MPQNIKTGFPQREIPITDQSFSIIYDDGAFGIIERIIPNVSMGVGLGELNIAEGKLSLFGRGGFQAYSTYLPKRTQPKVVVASQSTVNLPAPHPSENKFYVIGYDESVDTWSYADFYADAVPRTTQIIFIVVVAAGGVDNTAYTIDLDSILPDNLRSVYMFSNSVDTPSAVSSSAYLNFGGEMDPLTPSSPNRLRMGYQSEGIGFTFTESFIELANGYLLLTYRSDEDPNRIHSKITLDYTTAEIQASYALIQAVAASGAAVGIQVSDGNTYGSSFNVRDYGAEFTNQVRFGPLSNSPSVVLVGGEVQYTGTEMQWYDGTDWQSFGGSIIDPGTTPGDTVFWDDGANKWTPTSDIYYNPAPSFTLTGLNVNRGPSTIQTSIYAGAQTPSGATARRDTIIDTVESYFYQHYVGIPDTMNSFEGGLDEQISTNEYLVLRQAFININSKPEYVTSLIHPDFSWFSGISQQIDSTNSNSSIELLAVDILGYTYGQLVRLDKQGLSLISAFLPRTLPAGPGTHTIDSIDIIVLVDSVSTTGIQLPPGVNGRYLVIKKTDATGNPVTITPDGIEEIDGLSSYTLLGTRSSITLVFDGEVSNSWYII
jgi:hypothetical protein